MRTKFTKEEKILLKKLKNQRLELEEKRERNINRYIIPIEIKLENLREKIDNIECD
jgi:hypothetical protein